jgi:hypothetical protein
LKLLGQTIPNGNKLYTNLVWLTSSLFEIMVPIWCEDSLWYLLLCLALSVEISILICNNHMIYVWIIIKI